MKYVSVSISPRTNDINFQYWKAERGGGAGDLGVEISMGGAKIRTDEINWSQSAEPMGWLRARIVCCPIG